MNDAIQLDIRRPIGAVFALIGAILATYGLVAGQPKIPGAININLWWGLVMLVFGVVLLVLSKRSRPA